MSTAETLERPKAATEPPLQADVPDQRPASHAVTRQPTLREWLGVLAMVGGMFMAIMDVQIVTSSLPQIQKQLGADVRWRCSMKQAASKLGFRSAPLADLPTI